MQSDDLSLEASSQRRAVISFNRSFDNLNRLIVKSLLLSIVTLGIYRFWYMTRMRRFFWSRTVVDGSPAEYTGSGRELFLGFLLAMLILTVLYTVIFVISVLISNPAVASILAVVLLYPLTQLALYRGRRYRASRTRWRGIRLGQDGSSVAYAARSTGWALVVLLTLGLAFPFMRADLERYRMRHTLLGTARLHSDARGWAIFGNWLIVWAVAVVMFGLAIISALAAIMTNPSSLSVGAHLAPGLNALPDGKAVGALLAALQRVIVGAGIFVALFIPYYRAREKRAFLGAIRLGDARLVSHLRARSIYKCYLKYIALAMALGAGLAIVAGLIIAAAVTAKVDLEHTTLGAVLIGVAIVAYLVMIVIFSVLYVRTVVVGTWARVAESTTLLGAEVLEAVVAAQAGPDRGLGEGMADALDVSGAIEIGF